MYETPGAGVM